jgi:caffeoyl-CoA O-methyltransferase
MADHDSREGTRYDSAAIRKFVDRTHAPHDAALQRAYDAPAKTGLPAIQLAASEGKTLTLLMRLLNARKVVEIGTLAGYSALRIAQGLAPGGKLWTFELDSHHAQVARDNLAAAGVIDRVEIKVGPALEQLKAIEANGQFDAVFIDADKPGYPDYARFAQRHLRSGGLIIGDNAYYFGELMSDRPEATRMREFHQFVADHFDSVCLPTPDGLVIGIAR